MLHKWAISFWFCNDYCSYVTCVVHIFHIPLYKIKVQLPNFKARLVELETLPLYSMWSSNIARESSDTLIGAITSGKIAPLEHNLLEPLPSFRKESYLDSFRRHKKKSILLASSIFLFFTTFWRLNSRNPVLLTFSLRSYCRSWLSRLRTLLSNACLDREEYVVGYNKFYRAAFWMSRIIESVNVAAERVWRW